MREPVAVDSHLFAHVFWAEHLSWAPTTFYFAPSQNITRGEFVAYEWATLIYLQESASNFLIFHEHHSPSTFLFHLVSQILSSRLVTVFAFQIRGWLLSILSAENQTKLWTDQTELPWKKSRRREYDFSGRSRRTTRCRPRVCSLVWLVTDSTHAHCARNENLLVVLVLVVWSKALYYVNMNNHCNLSNVESMESTWRLNKFPRKLNMGNSQGSRRAWCGGVSFCYVKTQLRNLPRGLGNKKPRYFRYSSPFVSSLPP